MTQDPAIFWCSQQDPAMSTPTLQIWREMIERGNRESVATPAAAPIVKPRPLVLPETFSGDSCFLD